MKKGIAIILAIAISLLFTVGAMADEAQPNADNITSEISDTADATSQKAEQAAAKDTQKASQPDVSDLIRFVPTTIEVKPSQVIVSGYFINLDSSKSVSSFQNFTMDVYMGGSLLISGSFGTINDFTVYPGRTVYQTFTFNGSHDLNVGYYVCDDSCYCVTAFRFLTSY